jgi:hypothetical protein
VSASDGAAWSVAVISNIVAIENTPPEVTDLVVAPDVIYTDDTVTATVATRDLDGDPVSVEYHWVVNGSVVTAGVSGATLDGLVAFDKHATVQVGVSPSDGFDEGITAVSDPLVVRNTPPEAPSVEVLPTLPEPEDDLVCTIVVESFDLDDDAITYSYAWYVDGFSTPYSGSTLPASATAHGERWECDVTPFDGDDVGPVVVDSVVVNDLTEPDPPQFDEAVGHTNDTEHTLSGDCEAGCAVVMYCDDSSGTDTYAATCDSVDRFSVDVSLTAADTTECYATCTDGAGNTSGDSDVLTIEVCSPIDVYEDDDTYGDLSSDAIDEWGDVADDGSTTVTIRANVLDEDDDDWYAITATDELAEDLAAGSDAFDFQIEMTAGSDEYRFLVHKGSGSLGDLECPDEDGYTEYNWYNADVGDGDHGIPSDPQACGGSGSAAYNECQDDGDVFYIRVFRRPSVPDSCGHYELDISNGG